MTALVNSIPAISSRLTVALLAFALIVLLIRFFACALGLTYSGKLARALFPRFNMHSRQSASIGRVIISVLAAFLLSRALIWLIGLICALCAAYSSDPALGWGQYDTVWEILRSTARNYAADWRSLAVQWDAPHYLGIAQNGYVTQGDARFHIVFYPLYPYLVRALKFITGDVLSSAVLLSNSCLLASGFIMYKLTELSYGAKAGARSVWLFMFCPAGAFFSVAYTESLFIFLTLAAVYAARRHKFALAVALGALSAFTRSPGLIAAVPIFYEMLRADADAGRYIGERGAFSARKAFRRAALRALCCLPVLAGLGAYLLVNKLVTGDALTFMTYQWEHWYQKLGSVSNTVRYTLTNALTNARDSGFYGIWLPQSVFILLVAPLIAIGARRVHPCDGAYSLVYYVFTVCPTWLLSAPRYLCGMYSLYPTLARLCRNKKARIAVYILEAALFVYCNVMYTFKHWLL